MKRIAIGLIAIAVIGLVTLLFVVKRSNHFMTMPMTLPENGLSFEVAPGASFAAVSRKLVVARAIESDFWFRLYVRWQGQGGSIQAGDYLIEAGTTPVELLTQFTQGAVRLYAFTLVEGWNHREVLAALQANDAVLATMDDADWPALLAELGADVQHPEGLFLPETYRFPRATSDKEVLRQAYELMQKVLSEEWQARDAATPVISRYEALVLASIVEKETARVDERPIIAGVFARRLGKRMRLQTDPTVIYGIGPAFNGNLTRKDLRTDTPYNTYTRHGLPPTPIAMPGRAAINAALHPSAGEALYFVATGRADGSHRFSVTKEEHDAAVEAYLQRLRQQRRSGG